MTNFIVKATCHTGYDGQSYSFEKGEEVSYFQTLDDGFVSVNSRSVAGKKIIHSSMLEKKSKRNEEDYVSVVRDRTEMLDSYMMAILKCGGSPKSFIKEIETMTVKEMIDILAQNGVRFTTNR